MKTNGMLRGAAAVAMLVIGTDAAGDGDGRKTGFGKIKHVLLLSIDGKHPARGLLELRAWHCRGEGWRALLSEHGRARGNPPERDLVEAFGFVSGDHGAGDGRDAEVDGDLLRRGFRSDVGTAGKDDRDRIGWGQVHAECGVRGDDDGYDEGIHLMTPS